MLVVGGLTGAMFAAINVVGNFGTVRAKGGSTTGRQVARLSIHRLPACLRCSWTSRTGSPPSPPGPAQPSGWVGQHQPHHSNTATHPHAPTRTDLVVVVVVGVCSSSQGYLLGGFCWFAIPFALATSLGLACLALRIPITAAQGR